MIKSIDVSDKRFFNTITEVMNECFAKNYKGCMKAFLPQKNDVVAWFPKLAIKRGGSYVASSRAQGWVNVLTSDGEMLIEENPNDSRGPISDIEILPRYTFAYYEGVGYKSIGVFELDVNLCKNRHREYRRTSTHADLSYYWS